MIIKHNEVKNLTPEAQRAHLADILSGFEKFFIKDDIILTLEGEDIPWQKYFGVENLINADITKLNNNQIKQHLQNIIRELDVLDEDDYFSTEGWRHLFGIHD